MCVHKCVCVFMPLPAGKSQPRSVCIHQVKSHFPTPKCSFKAPQCSYLVCAHSVTYKWHQTPSLNTLAAALLTGFDILATGCFLRWQGHWECSVLCLLMSMSMGSPWQWLILTLSEPSDASWGPASVHSAELASTNFDCYPSRFVWPAWVLEHQGYIWKASELRIQHATCSWAPSTGILSRKCQYFHLQMQLTSRILQNHWRFCLNPIS